jgi:hypothetical protein
MRARYSRSSRLRSRDPQARGPREFRLGPIDIKVSRAGTVQSPMTQRPQQVYRYRVSARAPNGASFATHAWGSIDDYERRRHHYEDAGAGLVDCCWRNPIRTST